jgi:hypothetical protein
MSRARRTSSTSVPAAFTVFTVFTLALLAPRDADAQDARRVHVSVGASASYPSGRFNERADVGAGVTGSLEYELPRVPLGLRVDASYDRFGLPSRYLTRFAGADDGHTGITSLGATGVWRARWRANLQPYALAGVSVYRRHLEVTEPTRVVFADPFWGLVESAAPTQVVADTRTVNKVGVSGGLGVRYRFGPASAFLEGRYTTAYTRHRTRYVPVTLGLRW